MEAQKNAPAARSSTFSMKRAFNRFEELKSEFFRIQWTEESSVSDMTKVVVLATFVCGMVLYIADLIVQRALIGFDGVLRLIFG
jgi:preprotein translocase subunit SecE